jgi:ubiquinone/menaquinone biosynthesis C-methylase UbiE
MAHHICPWWLGYFHVSPLRRLVESPTKLLAPLVREGMVVVEPGCGMGFFTLHAARMVGHSGRVVAVDLQERMLRGLERRARRAGLAGRIERRLATAGDLGVDDLAGAVDLALALHVVHEVPDQAAFFGQLAHTLKPGGRLLVVEPKGHVKEADLARSMSLAERQGLAIDATASLPIERSALLLRTN